MDGMDQFEMGENMLNLFRIPPPFLYRESKWYNSNYPSCTAATWIAKLRNANIISLFYPTADHILHTFNSTFYIV